MRAPRLAWLAVGLAAVTGWSCDGPGNSGKFLPDPNLVRDVPWLNGMLPAMTAAGEAVVPSLPVYPPIALGVPDPGSQRLNCAPLEGLEFAARWFDDFEPHFPASTTGVAGGWSAYDDLSEYAFHVPGDITWYPGVKGTADWAWGLPAEKTPGPSCDGKPNNWAMHFRGGLFRKWGGGASHAFVDPAGQVGRFGRLDATGMCDADVDFCPPPVMSGATTDTAGLPLKAANGEPYLQNHDFFDVSKYEGIAFWARRGPEGHHTALVILTDKFTSDRLNRENQTFCRRIRECRTACLNGAPCSDDGTGVFRCFDPRTPLPTLPEPSLTELMYPRCGKSACTSPVTYLDRDFDAKECRPYTFPGADQSGEYCWNPTDPPPPSRDERCQDGWQTSVELTPDWKFYALPFTQFGQVGFGKRAPYMDLKSLDTIAFGATMGWSDVYFDNVTLYRRKK